jgi:hypothetical protein
MMMPLTIIMMPLISINSSDDDAFDHHHDAFDQHQASSTDVFCTIRGAN